MMGWFSNLELDSLDKLLLVQLQDLYDAEIRLVDAIPKMAEGAHCVELKDALNQHLAETRGHVSRLEQIFQELGVEPMRMTCAAMKGIIAEGDEILSASGDCCVRDAAIIAAAQRVEHYEMAGYGSVRTWAEQLGHVNIAHLLQATLDEEGHADKILTEIAEQSVNVHAGTIA
jgi:ferritin-like metal-binding protein YciE